MRKIYDIHMHLIPEVDDGAWNLDMALTMVQMAYCQGVRKIFATPHSSAFREGPERVEAQYRRLVEHAGRLYPDLEILMGCEVLLTEFSLEQIIKELGEGRIPSMNGTGWVLAEFRQDVDAQEAEKCIDRLKSRGWNLILAHAERYRFASVDHTVLRSMAEKGCLIQVNAYSLDREERGWIRENARWMLEERLISFLGSDAHRTFHRPPEVEGGTEYLYGHTEREYADAVAFGNAQMLLCGNGRKNGADGS